MTRVAVVLSVALWQLLCLAPAGAAGALDEVAGALRNDPVYVDPAADPTLTASESARLRDAIQASDARPVFVAVVGGDALAAAGGDPQLLVERVADDVGIAGTYAVVADGRFRTAGRGTLSAAVVVGAADAAFAEGRSRGVAGVLQAFVRRLGGADAMGTGLPGGPDPNGSAAAGRGTVGDTNFAVFGLGGLLLPLLLLGGAIVFVRRLARRRSFGTVKPEQEEFVGTSGDGRPFADVRALAEQDVLDLGADIYELDPLVHTPTSPRAALDEFRLAVGHYDRAQERLAVVRDAGDLASVTEAIEEGRYSLAAVRARLAGHELPERRAPCFFDPRHGPSTVDVEWAPPGGAPRLVPACAMDADRVLRGADPAARELVVDGERMPYWDAPVRYRGWAGGWFGGFGGPALLGGLVIGGLGGMFAADLLSSDDFGEEGSEWDTEPNGYGGVDLGDGHNGGG